jgi:hypothetical protein
VTDLASSRFGVDIEPATASRSFWRKLLFARLNFASNLAAGAVAAEQGDQPPRALDGSRIVVSESTSGKEVWQLAIADVTGGTSPEQLLDDIRNDLSIQQFIAKWGIAQ